MSQAADSQAADSQAAGAAAVRLLAAAGRRIGAALARAPAWTLTAVAGVACIVAAPPSADLAAASYRSDLFGHAGFTLWDNGWYGGHHLPAYSVLAPALGWLVGPRLLAALSLTVATALFVPLASGRFEPRAVRLGSLWFALGAAVALLAFRVPFDLGLALGMGALALAQRGRRAGALALALLAGAASPVAAGFLALAALAWWLSLRARMFALWLAVAALAPVALLALMFPEGGYQPFAASAFYPPLAAVLAIAALVPTDRDAGTRVLRAGVLLYVIALIGAYVLRTPVGGNVDRLGSLAGGPLAALALVGHRSAGAGASWRARALALLAPALVYWQAIAPITDAVSAAHDPAVHASYYAPLLSELSQLRVGYDGRPARIEVVPTTDHWEARYVAAHIAIARGWERQLDIRRNALFYSSAPLTATRFRAWLADEAISLVALPDAPLDYSGRAEATLLRSAPPPNLRLIWRSAHWRLYQVLGATPLAQPPARLTQLGGDTFTLQTPSPGRFLVRVRFTPYWRLARGSGCVGRASNDWTQLRASSAGSYHVTESFSFTRVFEHGPRCR